VGSTPYSRPQPELSSPSQNFAEEQAERSRRDAERIQQQLDQSAGSAANMFQRVPVCSNCRKQVTEEEVKRSSCPHCGARWTFNQYTPSSKSGTSGSSLSKLSGAASERAVRSVIIIVGAVVVVVVLCGGAIAVAMAIASASRPKQHYRI
jgi:DNA-directed RNA polymerase subunit RPC12/RpoP